MAAVRLRNPAVVPKPLGADEAAALCQAFRRVFDPFASGQGD